MDPHIVADTLAKATGSTGRAVRAIRAAERMVRSMGNTVTRQDVEDAVAALSVAFVYAFDAVDANRDGAIRARQMQPSEATEEFPALADTVNELSPFIAKVIEELDKMPM